MKKTKEILNILLIIMLIVTIVVISRTYALFESNREFSINMDVARWNIKVNDVKVKAETTESFIIKNLVLAANSKVVNGKVAPGSEGTFDIEIDFEDTDVSVQGEINIDADEMEEAGLTFNSMTVDDTTLTITQVSDTKSSFVVPLSKIRSAGANNSYKITIHVEFEWANDENRNKQDTLIGLSQERTKMAVPISIKFKQYIE